MTRSRVPRRIRKQFVNNEYPFVLLRFEDGHEIVIARGSGKQFDAFPGETVKVLAVYDRDNPERVLIGSVRTEEFDSAAD
jgi:hypothetical protein